MIEAARAHAVPALSRVVVAIDPAVSSGEGADEGPKSSSRARILSAEVGSSPMLRGAISRQNGQKQQFPPIAPTVPIELSPKSTTAAKWSKRRCG